MEIQITRDQRYCSFGDGVVYKFTPLVCGSSINPCHSCAFFNRAGFRDSSVKCYAVPCQEGQRNDKNVGFWDVSQNVDYQLFKKMLRVGG